MVASPPSERAGTALVPLDYETIQTSVRARIRELLESNHDESRRLLLEKTPDLLESLFKLADGVKVKELENTYYVPPDRQSLQYLLNWVRDLMGQSPAKRVIHELNEKDRELLAAAAGKGEDLTVEKGEDGVFRLKDD